MSETIARRRAAWQALRMGPLWQPLASRLPGAGWPGPDEPPSGAIAPDPDQADISPMQAPEAPDADLALHAFTDSTERTPHAAPAADQEGASVLHDDDDADAMPRARRWQELRNAVADCQRCTLAGTRRNTVFGRGRPGQARWLLIGEAPGAEEDRQGEAFVGQAGKLLDAMLHAAGIDPDADVFIANVLKCRPPGNRNPAPSEVVQCEPFLHEQIRLTRPDCILLLGRFAAQSVLGSDLAISRLRNKLHHIRLDEREIPVVVTFHPAYLLRNPADKLRSWEDLCLAQSAIAAAGEAGGPMAARPIEERAAQASPAQHDPAAGSA